MRGVLTWLGLMATVGLAGCGGSEELDGPPAHVTDARWVSSDNLRVTVNSYGRPKSYLTSGFADFKPVWSKTEAMVTFFRQLRGGSEFFMWKTKLCVIGADGTGLRELTSGDFTDFNPTWTRDGSNLILFNRYAVRGSDSNDIYWTSPTASPGEEVMLSSPKERYEWVFSGLRDGRLFIDRISFLAPATERVRSFLLTPNPGGVATYEEVARPTTKFWHKLSVSPSETKVAYMLDNNDNMSTYADVVLYYADFDVRTLTVTNPVAITLDDPQTIEEYPRWSADESLIIYDSNRSGKYQMYAYRLADGTTERVSDGTSDSQFGNFENLPK